MTHSTLAIYNNRELYQSMKKLHDHWESFLTGQEPKLDNMRQNVHQSWMRCQNYNVNPLQKKAPIVMDQEHLHDIYSNTAYYQASLSKINLLSKQIQGTEHVITLSDNKGKIIHLQGENDILQKAEQMNFVIGADWSEKMAGTNAIGTAIAIKKPIQIWAFEHFCAGVHDWICSAAPIIHPVSGEVLGVIDLTGPRELAQAHSLSVVQSYSKLIEIELAEKWRMQHSLLKETYQNTKRTSPSPCLIVVNELFDVVTGDEKCLNLLQIDHWNALWSQKDMKWIQQKIRKNNIQQYEQTLQSVSVKLKISAIFNDKNLIGYQLIFEPFTHITRTSLRNTVRTEWNGMTANSKEMKKIISKLKVVANTPVPILITGESGTGKELIATKIHASSQQLDGSFLSINCGAIPKNLIASELFGYEPGTFTGGDPKGKIGLFEKAKNGTVFLDEIGEMPLDLQVHLLRVLQEKEITRLGGGTSIPINVRIIAATNKNLQSLIEKKSFRLDLYYRLNVVELHLPPLRERTEDLPYLIKQLLKELAEEYNKPIPTLDTEATKLLYNYHWPGNIRELRNVLEFSMLFQEDNVITAINLPKQFMNISPSSTNELTLLELKEKEKLYKLLLEEDGNISAVARRCGIARTTLYRKIKKYHLLVN